MIINPSDLDQIITNGQAEVARISEQLAEGAHRINGYEAELAKIHTGREARLKELQDARADVASLQDALNQAMAYAKQAHATPQEAQATKAVSSAKKELSTAQKRLEQLEAKHAEAEQVEQGSQNELLDQMSQAQATQHRLADELSNAEKAHAGVCRQQAEQKLDTILQAYVEQEQAVDERAGRLVEAQAALLDLHSDAIQALSGYPDLQRAIEDRKPLGNETTRLFEATIWYLDAFMSNARDVDMNAKLASLRNTADGSYQDVLRQVVVHESELFDFLRRAPDANPPATLPATRERLQELLEEYRAWKQANKA